MPRINPVIQMQESELIISEAFQISDRGTGVFFEGSPADLPVTWGVRLSVVLTRPDSTRSDLTGYKEYARTDRVELGEMVGLVLIDVKAEEVPIGSRVKVAEVLDDS